MRKITQYIGTTHNKLTIIGDAGNKTKGDPLALVRCECGVEKVIILANVLNNRTKSCGCLRSQKKTQPSVLKSMNRNATPPMAKLVKGGAFVYNGELYQVVKL